MATVIPVCLCGRPSRRRRRCCCLRVLGTQGLFNVIKIILGCDKGKEFDNDKVN